MRHLRLIFWTLTAAYWVLVCTLTHLPPQYLPHVHMDDKLEHVLAYGALAGMLAMALWVTFPRRPWLALGVLLVGLAYGAADELTQPYVGRTCDIEDWVADVIGTMAGVLPVLVAQRLYRRRFSGPSGAADVFSDDLGAEMEATLEACDGMTEDEPAAPASSAVAAMRRRIPPPPRATRAA